MLLSFFKKCKYFVLVILTLTFVLFCNSVHSFAAENDHDDLTKELSYSEENELFEYDALSRIIKDIFSFDKERGDASVNNIGNLLYDLIDTGLQKFSDISDTSLYKYVQGIAIMFLMINFLIKVYQEFDTGLDDEVYTKEFIRECIVLIIALILILVLKYFVIFIFSFFRFLMDKMLYLRTTNELGSVVDISNNVKSDRIAYEILREGGLVGRGSLVEEISKRSKEASLNYGIGSSYLVSSNCFKHIGSPNMATETNSLFDITNLSAYSEYEYSSGRSSFNAGLRVEWNHLNTSIGGIKSSKGYFRPFPTIGYSFTLDKTKGRYLSASYSRKGGELPYEYMSPAIVKHNTAIVPGVANKRT